MSQGVSLDLDSLDFRNGGTKEASLKNSGSGKISGETDLGGVGAVQLANFTVDEKIANVTNADYACAASDTLVFVTHAVDDATRIITLPATGSARAHVVRIVRTGTFATNRNITIDVAGGGSIFGTVAMNTDYAAVQLVHNGANWFSI